MAEAVSTEAPELTRRATAPVRLQELLHQAKYTPANVEIPKETPLMELPDGEALAFRHLAHSIVSRTLAHEMEHRRTKGPEMAPRDWKLLKRHDELSIFKRRAPEQSQQTQRPMVLCVGSISGELEDILYGVHAKTRDEMQMVLPHMRKGYVNCALLAKLEGGSKADPYRQLALKWHLTDVLGDAKILKHRDLCKLESMGISTDAQGERYAYYLLQSVDFAGCPPPQEHSDTIRANMMFCSIYRQAPGSHTVEVYAKGMFDLGGDIPAFLVYNTSCALMVSIISAVESAEAKRLTLLAVQKAENSAVPVDDLSKLDLDDCDGENTPSGYSNSGYSLPPEASAAISATTPMLSRLLSKGNRKSRSRRQTSAEPCCVCSKKPAMASLMGATHRTCGVCLRGVCNKCHVKRRLFARPHLIPVACCKSCLLEAKQVSVDPLEPCPSLS
ncbi:Zinc finger, RING/FYVE/PHD-type [Phytophthora cinnamomi]|uniref:Zinc finger, RING/FYVE/PHD-type n=1 Tax=Phytophthora cinnamomi TaxID=4785 RepID=UPI003559AD90|nr:Zinc finger, RING/FYVE/PHD-type [Phytophthora cinnamomi]